MVTRAVSLRIALTMAVIVLALGALSPERLVAGEEAGIALVPAAGRGSALGSIATGGFHSCAVRNDGTIACWGMDLRGQSTPPAGTFSQVASGTYGNCGVKTDGTLACWGINDYGQSTPPAGTFTQVAVCRGHACGVKTDGTIACWGDNSHGESMPPAGTFTQVELGAEHSCGLRTDGTIACWGDNGSGQSTPPDGTFTQVAAGSYHTCALKTDGTIACWGENGSGQSTPVAGTFNQVAAGNSHSCGLGADGTIACWGSDSFGQSTPPAGTFTQVAAGAYHTCGLKTDGAAACWGDDRSGQSDPPASSSFSRRLVTAGTAHTCGLRTDGTLDCWGENAFGQSTSPAGTFTQAAAGGKHTCGLRTDGTPACWGDDTEGQSTVPPGTFFQVVAGGSHTCGVKTDGTLSCWGEDASGQATVPPGTFIQVAAGDEYTCGVKTDGTLACWGENASGQSAPPVGTFNQIAAGGFHACGLKTNATIACWGDNSHNQSAPPEGMFTQVAAGGLHTCGLRTSGKIACWGDNLLGQSAPPDGTFTQVVAGGSHTCGLKTGGTVVCWGADTQGQVAEVGLSLAASSGAESTASATFNVVLSAASKKTITVKYATAPVDAAAGSDFTSRAGTLTFNPGQTSKTITVPIINDTKQESDETFTVTLTNPVNATLGATAVHTYAILDEDLHGAIKLSASAYSIGEAGPAVTITARRIGGSTGEVTVVLTTSDGTAMAGSDYDAPPPQLLTLTWLEGDKADKTIMVPIAADALDEPNETFTVALDPPTGGAALGSPSAATVTITDNDPLPKVQFSLPASSRSESSYAGLKAILSAASAKKVVVQCALANGTAISGSDYYRTFQSLRFNPGETQSSFDVGVINDALDEPDETFAVTLTSASNAALGAQSRHVYTIADDDDPPTVQFSQAASSGAESTASAAINVVLSAASARKVTVKYATTPVDPLEAAAGSDYSARSGTLTLNPGQTSKTISVPILNDTKQESDEAFTVTLTAPANATLGATDAHTYTILDEDLHGAIKLSAAASSIGEAGSAVKITAQRIGGGNGEVSVNFTTSDGTAIAGSDYVATAGTLTWPDGNKANQTITVPIANDGLDEANETFTVTLDPPTGGAALGSPSAATVTISDNEPTPTVRFSLSASSGPESAAAAIDVTLSRESGKTITVKYATSNGTATAVNDYVKTSGTLTFDAGVTSRTITVPIVDDATMEPDQTLAVTLTSPVNALLGLPAKHVYTILNDEPAAPDQAGAAALEEQAGSAALAPEVARPAAAATANDFDGDGRSDYGVFDASSGLWSLRLSAGGEITDQFGFAGSVPVSGDFDGDGRSDYGVFDASSGLWSLRLSAGGEITDQFGSAGSVPVSGDFDGDGRSDYGVFDASSGLWSLRLSRGGDATVELGSAGSVAITGDFDGDGLTDCGCYTPATGSWGIALSSGGLRTETLGSAGAIPLVGDFDGDGTADFGYYSPSVPGETEGQSAAPGRWQIMQSTAGPRTESFGGAGAIPIGGALR